jgi:hypothetical protein
MLPELASVPFVPLMSPPTLLTARRSRDLTDLVEFAIATGTPAETPVSNILAGMIPIPNAVQQIKIPPAFKVRSWRARFTYTGMLAFADVDGIVRCSRRRLAEATGQSYRVVRALIAIGIVEKVGGNLRCLLRTV